MTFLNMAAVEMDVKVDTGPDSNEIDEKKIRVTERIQRRQQERTAELKKKQDERQNRSAKNESVDLYTNTFVTEKAAIENRIENIRANSAGASKIELIGIFDELAVAVQKLQKFATDSSLFLSKYDIRHSQDEVAGLQTLINEMRDEIIPKKKFAFKARKKAGPKQSNNNTTGTVNGKENCIDEADSKSSSGNIIKSNGNDASAKAETNGKSVPRYQNDMSNLTNKTNEVITLCANEVNGKDVGLTNLMSCSIQLRGSPSAVHMDRITDCKIFCGPVPGSVFVDNCVDSTLVLSCQQLRVHHTKDSKFYLHVTSRGIIEDTTRVQFAPYNWTYPGIEQDYEKTELNRDRNNWDDIDDFHWLASDKHSPNWSLLPENERIQKWEMDSI